MLLARHIVMTGMDDMSNVIDKYGYNNTNGEGGFLHVKEIAIHS